MCTTWWVLVIRFEVAVAYDEGFVFLHQRRKSIKAMGESSNRNLQLSLSELVTFSESSWKLCKAST